VIKRRGRFLASVEWEMAMRVVMLMLGLATAVSADAQVVVPGRGPAPTAMAAGAGETYRRDERDALDRVRDARRAGQISRAEARGYRREARANGGLGDRLASDGLSMGDRRELDARAAVLRDRINASRLAGPRRRD